MSDDFLAYALSAYRFLKSLALEAQQLALWLWQEAQHSLPLAIGLGAVVFLVLVWALRRAPRQQDSYGRMLGDLPKRPHMEIPPPDYSQRESALQSDQVRTPPAPASAPSGDFLARAGLAYSHSDDVASRRQHLQDIESRLIELKTLYQSGLISLEAYAAQSRQLARKL